MQKIILSEEEIRQIYQYSEKRLDKTLAYVVQLLDRSGETVAIAESCTGGMLASLLTSIPGASHVFELGFVTYAERMKSKFLFVSPDDIAKYGVVSEKVASAMLYGLQKQSDADLCIAITGLAGPDGGTPEQPIGTAYVGLLLHDTAYLAHLKLWEYDKKTRDEIRQAASVCVFGFAERILMEESRCRTKKNPL